MRSLRQEELQEVLQLSIFCSLCQVSVLHLLFLCVNSKKASIWLWPVSYTHLFDEFTENLEAARRQLGQCRYIRLLQTPEETGEESDVQGTEELFDYDRSKLILSTLHSSLNGPELAGILRRKYHLEVEMTTENYEMCIRDRA